MNTFEIKDNILIKYHGKENYLMIPDGITRIGEYSFCNRESLCTGIRQIKGVYIPEGVVSVGYSAFRNCYNLERVSLPESLVRIESFAFRNTNIKELAFPDNLRYFNDDAFYYPCLKKVSYRGVIFSPVYECYARLNISHVMKSLRTDTVSAMEILLKTIPENSGNWKNLHQRKYRSGNTVCNPGTEL